MRISYVLGLVVLVLAAALASPAARLAATNVEPIEVQGNPTCEALALTYGAGDTWQELRVTPPATVGSNGTLTVTVTYSSTAGFLDWSSNIGVDAVFVKGGNKGNLYIYNPDATSDTGLHTPLTGNGGQFAGVSHVLFCYDVDPATSTPTNTPVPPTSTPTVTATPVPPTSTPTATATPTTPSEQPPNPTATNTPVPPPPSAPTATNTPVVVVLAPPPPSATPIVQVLAPPPPAPTRVVQVLAPTLPKAGGVPLDGTVLSLLGLALTAAGIGLKRLTR